MQYALHTLSYNHSTSWTGQCVFWCLCMSSKSLMVNAREYIAAMQFSRLGWNSIIMVLP